MRKFRQDGLMLVVSQSSKLGNFAYVPIVNYHFYFLGLHVQLTSPRKIIEIAFIDPFRESTKNQIL